MTETNKKLSRREAIKLLGTATGASLLANIPAKWSKPELTGGVLPAHAQISDEPLYFICNQNFLTYWTGAVFPALVPLGNYFGSFYVNLPDGTAVNFEYTGSVNVTYTSTPLSGVVLVNGFTAVPPAFSFTVDTGLPAFVRLTWTYGDESCFTQNDILEGPPPP